MKLIAILTIVSATAFANPGDVPLTRDAPTTTGITNYVLYAATNTMTAANLTNAPVKVNVGTNRLFTVESPAVGKWWFAVTAQKDGLESGPSNILAVEVPAAPANMRTIFYQYAATLTNGFIDTGYFRLRIGAP